MMYVIHFGNGLSTYALKLNFGLFLPVRCTGQILVFKHVTLTASFCYLLINFS